MSQDFSEIRNALAIGVRFSRQEKAVLVFLLERGSGNYGGFIEAIGKAVSSTHLAVIISGLRKRLKPIGWTILSSYDGTRSYRLEKTSE
jgi:hypothetical protein